MKEGKPNRLKSMPSVGEAVSKFYVNYKEFSQQGKTTCRIIGYPCAQVILRSHDINYMYLPSYAATTAARHMGGKLSDLAEKEGFVREICSYTRNNIGCALCPEEVGATDPMYVMPKPDFIVVCDDACTEATDWANAERRIYNVPLFVTTLPYIWDEADEKEAVAEVARQLRELISFLEDITHRAFDWDKYRETMALAKETAGLRIHTMDLACRTIPSPATLFDWTSLLGLINYYIGLPEGRDVAAKVREEVLERIRNKEGAVIPENCRLYWDGIMMWPYLGKLSRASAALGANVIWGRYSTNSFWQDPDEIDLEDPLKSNAFQNVRLHLNRNIDWLIDTISDNCQRFSIDGLLVCTNLTCRTFSGPQLEIMDGVSRRLGIPAVRFEGDMADESLVSESQLETRLQALTEMIQARKGRTA